MVTMEYQIYSYEELDKELLYQILRHRAQVLIVGRGDRFVDPDNFDQLAYHLIARDDRDDIF